MPVRKILSWLPAMLACRGVVGYNFERAFRRPDQCAVVGRAREPRPAYRVAERSEAAKAAPGAAS